MYGERARIGLIVPSSNTVCEPEMVAMRPEGVATYATRILFEPTIKGLKAMRQDIGRATLELSSEGICDIIAFCCTVGSMIGGADYDKKIQHFIQDKAGVPALTTTTAVRTAFNALRVHHIAVATPYTREINELEKKLLADMGYDVTQIKGCHEDVPPEKFKNDMIGRLPPERSYQMALQVSNAKNEAIFVSCTNFRAIENIAGLEKETGKPVVSSNQATLWHSLRTLGIKDPISGFGQLLQYH